MLLTEETLKQLKALISQIEAAVPYIEATIKPDGGNTFASATRPDWIEVHKGRAGSSVTQLRNLLADAKELKKSLP